MSIEEPIGTFDCPICGFDKPHTHSAEEIAGRGKWNENQKKLMKERSLDQYRMKNLKAEFERYGTVNSYESSMLWIWILDRLEKIEKQLDIQSRRHSLHDLRF
jgi:hypothetical protein